MCWYNIALLKLFFNVGNLSHVSDVAPRALVWLPFQKRPWVKGVQFCLNRAQEHLQGDIITNKNIVRIFRGTIQRAHGRFQANLAKGKSMLVKLRATTFFKGRYNSEMVQIHWRLLRNWIISNKMSTRQCLVNVKGYNFLRRDMIAI